MLVHMFIAKVSLETKLRSTYDSFTKNMVLESPFIGDTGEDCSAYSLFRSPKIESFEVIW